MATLTLDRVLASAEALPADERAMLEELLHRRRVENWRNETAAEAVVAAKAFRSGKTQVLFCCECHRPFARGQMSHARTHPHRPNLIAFRRLATRTLVKITISDYT